jgi:hypothetical protein
MIDELIKNPNHVQRLWNQARPAADRAYAARERDARLRQVKAQVDADTYDADGRKLDAATGPLLDDLNRRPAPAVDPDDAVEHYERFE